MAEFLLLLTRLDHLIGALSGLFRVLSYFF